MKVLHVITGLDLGGAETALWKLLGATSDQVEPRVVSLIGDGPMGERIRTLGIETVSLAMRRGVPDPRAIFALTREIRRFRPDVIQTWMYHADLVGSLASLLAGRPPLIWGIRNADLDEGTAKWTTRQTLRVCALLSALPERIVSCSERARDFHVAQGYRAEKMVVIPNGFDVSALRPDASARESIRNEMGIASCEPVIGMAARFHPMKDFRNFARAAGLAARNMPNIRFVLCGDGLTTDNLELTRWLREAGVLERTLLLGRRHDMARVYAALDLFTLSSATEGFPNVLGEAMACGVPCVATDAGDSRQVLGDTGIVVKRKDPAALADAWCTLLGVSAQERTALGASARERVVRTFAMNAVAVRFIQLYRSILDGTGGP